MFHCNETSPNLWNTFRSIPSRAGLTIRLTHSLTSRPSSMTVGDCRWPVYCLSSPLIPVLWHLLQLNVATATPLFYVVQPLSFGSWWRKPSTVPSKTVSAKFPALPLVMCPKYCNFIRATFPINSLSRPISSNIDTTINTTNINSTADMQLLMVSSNHVCICITYHLRDIFIYSGWKLPFLTRYSDCRAKVWWQLHSPNFNHVWLTPVWQIEMDR